MNRIAARVTEKVINTVQEFTDIAEDFPQKVQNELSNFKKEVIEEYERIEKQNSASKEKNSKKKSSKEDLIQNKIDTLRSKVIETNKDLEGKN